jgi:hypothetical protein
MLASGTFLFNGVAYSATSVQVEAPTAEIVNMTAATMRPGRAEMVPSGDITSPGRVTVEAISSTDPASLVGTRGRLLFTGVSRNAICETASLEARTADLFRVRMTFIPTDYYGS